MITRNVLYMQYVLELHIYIYTRIHARASRALDSSDLFSLAVAWHAVLYDLRGIGGGPQTQKHVGNL